ncbi:hypothetical protein AC231_18410 [Clostridium pasteurianum]|uniref:hypothetical protein n=1 Tax=Clostridium pasteurianum TaxID=1501 RepID=UPI00097625E4|nr:hypothetical protein [Clostridium pasteurianum]OMH19934.1 hypothetical protein AC231_18410 [Clostridium pasteurianum]
MNIDEKHKKIIEVVKNKLTCSAHNLDHVFRVYNCYVKLGPIEIEVSMPNPLIKENPTNFLKPPQIVLPGN